MFPGLSSHTLPFPFQSHNSRCLSSCRFTSFSLSSHHLRRLAFSLSFFVTFVSSLYYCKGDHGHRTVVYYELKENIHSLPCYNHSTFARSPCRIQNVRINVQSRSRQKPGSSKGMEITSPREIGFTLLFFDPVDLLAFSKVGIVKFLSKCQKEKSVSKRMI